MSESHFYSIDDGNQSERIYCAEIERSWINNLNKKYDWANFNQFDNKLWEYVYKFFDDVIASCSALSNQDLWMNLNRPQKVFWSFLAFGGDTDNGGVFQFLVNRQRYTLSVLEAWEELGLLQLRTDYEAVLEEILETPETLNKAIGGLNAEDQEWEKRYQAFVDGE